MKDLTGNRIHKTSLFIQPESKCNIGCEGCYSLKGKLASVEEAAAAKLDLFEIIRDTNLGKVEFDQITLSINSLDKKSMSNTQAHATMLKAVDKEKIHYAIAVNSIEDIEESIDLSRCSVLNISIDKNKIKKDTKIVTKISSWLTIFKEKNPDVHVNMNFLITEDDHSINETTENKKLLLQLFADKFDSVHLIMEKPANAEGFNLFSVSDDAPRKFSEMFKHYVKHAIAIKQAYGDKIFIDSCVETALQNIINNTTFNCRAGINHISMWQDGRFTGCAYRTLDTEYSINEVSAIKFGTANKISEVSGAEYGLCLYNTVLDLHSNIEEFASELKLNEIEIKTLKSLIK